MTAGPPGGLRATLSLPMVFCVALKQVIGGGVIVLTGTAVALAGAGASVAYLLACAVVLLISLPYAVLGAAVPVSGSLYRWPARFIGPATGFMAFWMVLGTHVGLAAYAATFGATLHALLPAIPARPAGLAALVLVLVLNLLGADISARAGILITLAVAAALVSLAVVGLPHVDPHRLTDILPNGWHGLLAAAALLTFPITGATLVSELAGEMRRPGRDIPVAILGSTVCAALLYVAVTLVAAGLPPARLPAPRSLNDVAALVMSPTLFVLFGLGTGIVSMLGIMNTHMLWGSRSVLMVCRDGWLPTMFGRPNRAGAPAWPLLLLSLIGAVPLLAGVDVATIIRVSALGASGSAILSVACAPLNARRDPAAYAASPLPVPRPALLVVSLLAIASQVATFAILLRDLPLCLTLLWLVWIGLGFLITVVRRPRVRLELPAG